MVERQIPPTHTLSPADARKFYRERRAVTQPEPPPIAETRDLQASGPQGPIALRLYHPLPAAQRKAPHLLVLGALLCTAGLGIEPPGVPAGSYSGLWQRVYQLQHNLALRQTLLTRLELDQKTYDRDAIRRTALALLVLAVAVLCSVALVVGVSPKLGGLLVVAVAAGGWLAFTKLPIDAFPEVSPVQVKIVFKAPGMTPVSVPLVAANDVAKASLMGRATGTLTYLIWGTPAS